MWQEELERLIPLLGHRNWIAVVDKAFPLQSSEGIITLDSGEAIDTVLEKTVAMVSKAPHLKPVYYLDAELEVMNDGLAPGVEKLKNAYSEKLAGCEVNQILHDGIFEKFSEACKTFSVVIIKTECCIPYSSIFINLDCGYWNSEAENKLRSLLTSCCSSCTEQGSAR